MITLVPIVLAQVALVAGGGASSVRGVLVNEQAAQNAGNWRAFYRQFDPVPQCSYKALRKSYASEAKGDGLTGRKGGRLRYSNIRIWTDDVTGDYAFASYDLHIGHRLVAHIGAGQDSFIRRNGRWYDRFENADYAADCFS